MGQGTGGVVDETQVWREVWRQGGWLCGHAKDRTMRLACLSETCKGRWGSQDQIIVGELTTGVSLQQMSRNVSLQEGELLLSICAGCLND